ncbi:MAG TPA: hypothetical protein VMW50_07870 [Dehalococcoidia bacterium]|nr:hypothetical protein [Dehalococcoidia bacterium]
MEEPKLVVDSDGQAVLKDGMPLYKYSDGTEQPLNLKDTLSGFESRISNLTEEQDRFFQKSKTLEEKLKAYGKITPEIAKTHESTVKKLEGKELVDQHGLEAYQKTWTNEVKASMTEEWEVKENTFKEVETGLKQEIKDMDKIIFDLAVNNKLGTHPYFAGEDRKTVYRPQDAAKIYGDRFKVERTGATLKVQALDRDGKVLLSKKNHGVPAEFGEAVELIVQQDNDGTYEIFRSSKPGGPRITGNMDTGGPSPAEGAKSVDLIRSGLKKHNRALQG